MKIKIALTRQENADYFQAQIGDIISVDFEEYVAAVVASEIGNSNIEACKAQAVAARTYAIYQGVLKGTIISDSSAVAQAYRAARFNSKKYLNCILAAQETIGQVIMCNDKIINSVYSSCNGGYTVSSKEHWGNAKSYLIAQEDSWDAATGKKKNGHGVGMSQVGAIYAGNHGILYKDILKFYYPNTYLVENYGNREKKSIKEQLLYIKEQLKKIKEEL